MDHGFRIELRGEVGHEVAALFVGEVVKGFELNLDHWRRWEYAESWQAQLVHLLGGAAVVALMTDVQRAGSAECARAFVVERRPEGGILVTERVFAAHLERDADGVVLAPLTGECVREVGRTTLDAVRRFVEGNR